MAIRLLICDCYVSQGNLSFYFVFVVFRRAIRLLICDYCISLGNLSFDGMIIASC